MRFRKLRIAWSVAWGIITVLLYVLWFRSHFVIEGVSHTAQTATEVSGYAVTSDNGTILIASRTASTDIMSLKAPLTGFGWHYKQWTQEKATKYWLGWSWSDEGFYFRFPTLLPETLCALIAYAPLSGFSLRTLLIGTTLVAAVLGAIIYAVG